MRRMEGESSTARMVWMTGAPGRIRPRRRPSAWQGPRYGMGPSRSCRAPSAASRCAVRCSRGAGRRRPGTAAPRRLRAWPPRRTRRPGRRSRGAAARAPGRARARRPRARRPCRAPAPGRSASCRLALDQRHVGAGHEPCDVHDDQHPPVDRGDAADEPGVDRAAHVGRGAHLAGQKRHDVGHRVHHDPHEALGDVEDDHHGRRVEAGGVPELQAQVNDRHDRPTQVDHALEVLRGVGEPRHRLARADLAHLQDVDRVLLGAQAKRQELVALGVGVRAHQNSLHSSPAPTAASAIGAFDWMRARAPGCCLASGAGEAWRFAGASAELRLARRKTDTASTISRASSFRDSEAAVDSSTSEAVCCVALSRSPTAWFTCTIPELCSLVADAISPMICETRFTLVTTSPMVWPAPSASLAPASTRCTESVMRLLISFAASAEPCARLLTSPATTAKPRPCSPARAASTAAFNARMLVWKAIESITPMMSPILRELCWMLSIIVTTWSTASPPRLATAAAEVATSLAWPAFCAFWFTVAVISSMEAAVSSRLEACSSVREERSVLPAAICDDAVVTISAAWRTRSTMPAREPFISCIEPSSWPNSSWRPASISTSRLPAATVRAKSVALRRRRVILRMVK